MALLLDLDAGDELHIGDNTVVRVEVKSGRRVRLRIVSNDDVKHVKDGAPPPAFMQRERPAVAAQAPEPVAAPRKSIFKREL